MAHIPVNHPLRPLYRTLAGLTGVYVIVFGVVGFVETRGGEPFAVGPWTALGLPTNRAFAVASLIAGAAVLLAALVGHNVDRFVDLWGGGGFLLAGTVMMPLSRTDANIFNFDIETTVVSYLIGMVLITAGLYGKVGTRQQAEVEEEFRHGAGER